MARQSYREKMAALVGYEGMPWPERCSILDIDAGGYLVVSTAFSDKPYPCPVDFAPNVRDKRKYLIFTIASVSRDGVVALWVSTTEADTSETLPGDDELGAMVETLRDTGNPPATFGKAPMDWERITHSFLMLGFIEHGYVYRLVQNTIRMKTEAAIRITKRYRALARTDGSLVQRLSRHRDTTMFHAAAMSTDMPWSVGHFRDRPWIREVFLEYWPDEYITSETLTAEKLATILSACDPGKFISEAAVKWCDRFFAQHPEKEPTFPFLVLLTALPRSWWPREVEDYNAMRSIAYTVLSLCDDDTREAVDMLRPSKGRFADYLIEMGKDMQPLLRGDYPDLPVPGSEDYASRRKMIFNRVDWNLADCHDMLESIDDILITPFRGELNLRKRYTIARQVVTRGGGIGRYLDSSKRWHEMPQIRELLAARDKIANSWTTCEWSPCVDPFVHEGIEVVEICTARELKDEGAALRHCIGSKNYVERFMKGTSRAVSFREGDTVMSTAEFRLGAGDGLLVIQHRGHENLEPPASSIAAMTAWKEAILNRTLATYQVKPIPMPDDAPDIAVTLEGYGPSAWRPVIRRDLAAMSWVEFGQQVREMHLAAYPEAPAPDPAPEM